MPNIEIGEGGGIGSSAQVDNLTSADAVFACTHVTVLSSVNRLIAASNIQAVAGSFSGEVIVGGSHSVAGVSQFSAASFSGNVTIATPGVMQIAVGTTALSSDLSAITAPALPSNSVRMVAIGTVLRFYFNQTGSVVLRGQVNLTTF